MPSVAALTVAALQAAGPQPLTAAELDALHTQRRAAASMVDSAMELAERSGLASRKKVAQWNEIRKDLAFTPNLESETPKGFPSYSPVNQIVLLQYPSYRMASAPNRDGSSSGFWTLFRHISRNDIAMTAPVQMQRGEGGSPKSIGTMSFLYPDLETGEVGKEGNVQVVDVAAGWCLSIGVRGEPNQEERNRLEKDLRNWLAKNPQLEACGELRVMGWNSPFVPRNNRFYEIQIPVRLRSTLLADGSTTTNQTHSTKKES